MWCWIGSRRGLALAGCGAALLLGAAPAQAGLFKHSAPSASQAADGTVREIQRAIDESRLVDAGRLLDEANLAGMKDPRLILCAGQLNLKRGRYETALEAFTAAEREPATRAAALEGQGIALSLLSRSDEAMIALKSAVDADPKAWRAWNALAGEYDLRRDWPQAEAAYAHALGASTNTAQVLNNRGYSRILQGRLDEAVTDLVAALRKDPGLAAARTNLRFAMAMRGEYDEALAGAVADKRPAALNNAGFAAMMRGDYDRAVALFEEAMAAKGEYYARASANLQMAKSLKDQGARNAAR
jgi:Flp pilus assembly protein TadD